MTSPIAPTTIDSLGTPPSTGDIVNFDARGDDFLGKLPVLVTQTNEATAATYQNAMSAHESAVSADENAAAALISKNAAADSQAAALISKNSAQDDAASALASKNAANSAATQVDVAGALAGLPPKAGSALKYVRVNSGGTAFEYATIDGVQRLHALSTAASLKNAVGGMFPIFDKTVNAAISSTDRLMRAGTQFLLVSSGNADWCYTSPDGETFTLRTMGVSSTSHIVRNNGANVIGLYFTSTTARVSTDGGVTWTASGAASGNVRLGQFAAYTSGGVFVSASTTQAYVTTNNGATWSALQTLPHTSSNIFAVGANLVSYNNASNTYYTSTTGLTGSWTLRTLPDSIAAGVIWEDGSGGLILIPTVTTKNFWGTSDGVTWVDLGFNLASYTFGGLNPATSGTFTGVPIKINGCWLVFNTATVGAGGVGAFVKYANSSWIPVYVDVGGIANTNATQSLVASNGAGLTIIKSPVSTNAYHINTSTTKCMSYFI